MSSPAQKMSGIEAKFNPWHDSENGQFTFAGSGSYFGQGEDRARSIRRSALNQKLPKAGLPQETRETASATRVVRSAGQVSGTLLSSLHREFLSNSENIPPKAGRETFGHLAASPR